MATNQTQTATATDDSTTSAKFDVRGFSCGSFVVPTSVTLVSYYAASSATDAAPDVLRSALAGGAVTTVATAGSVLTIPAECFNVSWLVIVLTGSSSASITLTLGTSASAVHGGTVTVTSTALTSIQTNTSNSAASLATIDDWDESDRAKVNPIVGQAGVAAGAGSVSATVQRVTLASDDPAVASLGVLDDWDSTDACKSVAIQKSVTGTWDSANLLAAAGDYAANDVLSNDATNGAGDPLVFSNLARIASGTLTVVGGTIASSVEAFAPRVRVWLLNAAPTTSEMDDNAAFALDLDDRAKVQGYFDFPAMVDAGEFSFATVSGLAIKCAGDASGHVYGIAQILDAATNESAGMSMWITLHVVQD